MSDIEVYDDYHEWLCDLVRYSEFDELFRVLDSTKFIYTLDLDSNRASDGMMLRTEYTSESGYYVKGKGPCSVLEMLIGLARRMDYMIGDSQENEDRTCECFWEMIDNLGLGEYKDDRFDEGKVREILDVWMRRQFCTDGKGSIFPLVYPAKDQRNLQIWYQMSEYIFENYG